jgi:hypothetical protein
VITMSDISVSKLLERRLTEALPASSNRLADRSVNKSRAKRAAKPEATVPEKRARKG